MVSLADVQLQPTATNTTPALAVQLHSIHHQQQLQPMYDLLRKRSTSFLSVENSSSEGRQNITNAFIWSQQKTPYSSQDYYLHGVDKNEDIWNVTNILFDKSHVIQEGAKLSRNAVSSRPKKRMTSGSQYIYDQKGRNPREANEASDNTTHKFPVVVNVTQQVTPNVTQSSTLPTTTAMGTSPPNTPASVEGDAGSNESLPSSGNPINTEESEVEVFSTSSGRLFFFFHLNQCSAEP